MGAVLSEADAEALIRANAFATSRIGTVGVELEWILRDPARPQLRPDPHHVRQLLPPVLPAGGRVSFEPGGQLELSSAAAPSLERCIRSVRQDLSVLRGALGGHGLLLDGTGLDARTPARVVDLPRYAALESHYDGFGPYGRVMMSNAASVQICLDAGDESTGWRGYRRRWWLANTLGPVLVAMFANSPGPPGTGWRSTRQVLRLHTDPSRTLPLPTLDNPRETWCRYALDAFVVGLPRRLSMRQWLRGAGPGAADADDLMRHLKTVIPPVRPCGYLEIRMVDAQPDDSWVVPLAVVGALVDDEWAAHRAGELLARLPVPQDRGFWLRAARHGLRVPLLAGIARGCLAICEEALDRMPVAQSTRDAVAAFAARYTARGRSPADDATPPTDGAGRPAGGRGAAPGRPVRPGPAPRTHRSPGTRSGLRRAAG